jgi:hypothetical protein
MEAKTQHRSRPAAETADEPDEEGWLALFEAWGREGHLAH